MSFAMGLTTVYHERVSQPTRLLWWKYRRGLPARGVEREFEGRGLTRMEERKSPLRGWADRREREYYICQVYCQNQTRITLRTIRSIRTPREL